MAGPGRSRRAEQNKQQGRGRASTGSSRTEEGTENSTQEAGGVAVDVATPTLDKASQDISGEPLAAQPAQDTSWAGMLGSVAGQAMGAGQDMLGAGQQAMGGVAQGAESMGHMAWALLPESAKSAIGDNVDVDALYQSALKKFGLSATDGANVVGEAMKRRAADTAKNRNRAGEATLQQADTTQTVQDLMPIAGNVQSRGEFVAETVLENTLTASILDTIWRYFPSGTRCIGGYLDDADQKWKINYHWELWRWAHDDLVSSGVMSAEQAATLQAHRSSVDGQAPSGTGYMHDSNVGDTADDSTPSQVSSRHSVLKDAKKDLKTIVNTVGTGSSSNSGLLTLAGQPVAAAGTSKHGTGYAVDIKGSNSKIVEIANKLGASLVYDEQFHIHVEFASGVNTAALDAENATVMV